MATLAVMVSQDVAALVVLVIIAVSYTIAMPTRPALSAVVPAIARERQFAVANAVLGTIRQVMTFVGPLLGVVVALWSPTAGFAVNGATFAVSGAILATVRRIPHRAHSEHMTPGRLRGLGLISSFRDGFSVVRSIRRDAAARRSHRCHVRRPRCRDGAPRVRGSRPARCPRRGHRIARRCQRDLEPRVRMLAALGNFDGASEASPERIAADVEPVDAATGNVVICEGDQPDDLYVVVSGSLVVSVEGRPVGLARRHPRSLGTPTLKRDMAMSSRV